MGTRGEDSDLSTADYAHLCGDSQALDGVIFDQLAAIAAAAAVALVGLGLIAVVRRQWWPTLLLCFVLALVGVGCALVPVR